MTICVDLESDLPSLQSILFEGKISQIPILKLENLSVVATSDTVILIVMWNTNSVGGIVIDFEPIDFVKYTICILQFLL